MRIYESYEEQYRAEIGTDKEYRTTIKEFTEWLDRNNMNRRFLDDLRQEDIYSTAVDYCLPISMIKYFKKTA